MTFISCPLDIPALSFLFLIFPLFYPLYFTHLFSWAFPPLLTSIFFIFLIPLPIFPHNTLFLFISSIFTERVLSLSLPLWNCSFPTTIISKQQKLFKRFEDILQQSNQKWNPNICLKFAILLPQQHKKKDQEPESPLKAVENLTLWHMTNIKYATGKFLKRNKTKYLPRWKKKIYRKQT